MQAFSCFILAREPCGVRTAPYIYTCRRALPAQPESRLSERRSARPQGSAAGTPLGDNVYVSSFSDATPRARHSCDVKSRSEEPTKRRREEEEDENILHAGRTHMTRDTHTFRTASRTQIIRKEAITSCRDRSNRRGTRPLYLSAHRGTDHPPNRPWKEGSLLWVPPQGFPPLGSGRFYFESF